MWPYPITQELLFECLKNRMQGDFWELVNDVISLAISRGFYPVHVNQYAANSNYTTYLQGQDKHSVPELIRQLMWKQLVRGLIVFGSDITNGNWPKYRVTGLGDQFLDGLKPQPYDPDNFLTEFKAVNPRVDPVIYDYLEESVKAFNANCLKSSAVMLGAASEKAILLLFDLFQSKITDSTKQAKFARDTKSWMISAKFNALHNRLNLMADGNKFPKTTDLKDIVIRNMPGFFDLVRRLRNVAGHPEIIAEMREETIFLNLRTFTEYITGIYKLLDYFNKNDADW